MPEGTAAGSTAVIRPHPPLGRACADLGKPYQGRRWLVFCQHTLLSVCKRMHRAKEFYGNQGYLLVVGLIFWSRICAMAILLVTARELPLSRYGHICVIPELVAQDTEHFFSSAAKKSDKRRNKIFRTKYLLFQLDEAVSSERSFISNSSL